MIFLFFAIFVFGKCYSQCLQNLVQNTFNYECIAGNFNGARIGIDSVVHTATGTGTVDVNFTFGAYLNGIYNSNFAYIAGDVIKIKPISIGSGVIEILTQEQGCVGTYNADHIGCLSSLPVLWLSTIKVKPILNSFQIT